MDISYAIASERRQCPVTGRGAAVVLMLIVAGSAHAQTIDWVDFSAYPAGAANQAGLMSADGLEISADFSTLTNIRPGWPVGTVTEVDDPTWPFADNQISGLGLISDFGATLVTTLSLEFTGPGGLPAGGSIGIFDLEDPSSTVRMTGLVDGEEVEPVWAVSFYQTLGIQAPPPVWDPSTATLSGTIPIGMAPGTVNNFAFMTVDRQLDALEIEVAFVDGDGVRFAVAGASVPAPDADSDGLGDNIDNCVLAANPSQFDADSDGIGNACDADFNNDCIVNAQDLGDFRAVFFTSDSNGDLNGDGIVNSIDLGILKTLFFEPPGPSGIPNICDDS